MYTERGVCANRLRQECRQSAGHPETREPPWHHWAEGWCADHTQVTQGLFTWRQLGHNPDRHHKEHRPRSGQAQRGEIRKGTISFMTFSEVCWYDIETSLLVQYTSLTVAPSSSHLNVTIFCLIGANHWAVFPWHLSSLPDLVQPRVEGQSLHGRDPVEKTGEGAQIFQIYDTKEQHQVVLQHHNTLVHWWGRGGAVVANEGTLGRKPLQRHAVFSSTHCHLYSTEWGRACSRVHL